MDMVLIISPAPWSIPVKSWQLEIDLQFILVEAGFSKFIEIQADSSPSVAPVISDYSGKLYFNLKH